MKPSLLGDPLEPRLVRLWRDSDEIIRRTIVSLAYLTSPVSIDTLVFLSGAPVVTILKLIKQLQKAKIIYQKKESGEGIYFFSGKDFTPFIETHLSMHEAKAILKRTIEISSKNKDQSEKAILLLAGLSMSLEEGKDLDWVRKAADILLKSGQKEKAILYYDYIIRHFSETSATGQ